MSINRILVWGALSAFVAICIVTPAACVADDSPNVLIIYADDLGYGDLSIQNPNSKIPTPNLDALAQQSLRFTDGHSSSGICTPSRYALLTGRYHWRKFHGIVNSFEDSVFEPNRLTLPEMLRTKGYSTAAIGKWHLGWGWAAIRQKTAKQIGENGNKAWPAEAYDWSQPIPNSPLAHGFDSYFGDDVINFPPYCWIENDHVVHPPDVMMDIGFWKPIKEGGWECRPGPMTTGWDPYQVLPTITEKAVQHIHAQAKSEKPFFLYFALPSPHAPIIPNDKFDGKSKAGAYGDFVFETDDACGQLLRALEESGQAKNTIVIFSADNGPENYAYPRDQKFDHWSANPFRGLKRDIYEGGHHVPFFINWPGVTTPGATSDALVSQIDLMATLAAIVGCELPIDQAEDSDSLLPLLRGETDSVRTTLVHNTFANQYAIRKDDWVLVDAKGPRVSKGDAEWETKHGYLVGERKADELYNLRTDVGQRVNVAGEHPEVVALLKASLKKIRDDGHSASRLSSRQ